MKTFAIRDGDLVVGPGGYETTEGPHKVRQDIGIALREPLGCDRFHPRWGTVLTDYVGGPQGELVEQSVRSEVNRVVMNYAAVRMEQMEGDASSRFRPRFGSGEIVSNVDSIQVRQEWDRLHVKISLRTVSGEAVTLLRSMGL